jgi:hypothetical protein
MSAPTRSASKLYRARGQADSPVQLEPRMTATPPALTALARLRKQRGPVVTRVVRSA